MGARAWTALGVAAIVVGAGCRQIVGIGDPVFNGAGSSGGAGSSATSGTTTGTTSGTGGGCTVTHPGGGPCEYLPGKECGCSDPGQKCSVIDPTTGASACITAGTTPDYAACTASADCVAGSWCELSASVCEPICVGTCAGGTCQNALQGSLSTSPAIPGLDVCTVLCNLVSVTPCGAGATCVALANSSNTVISSACVVSGMVAQGTACSQPQACAPGLACIANGTCTPWCTPSEAANTSPCAAYCSAFSPAVTVDGTTYGYCNP